MPVFTPPSPVLVPVISTATPKHQQRPFAYFKPSIPRGSNVWVYTNGVISVNQPPLWDAVGSTPGVKTVYYGGRSYEISDAEASDLTAAGFGDNIVY